MIVVNVPTQNIVGKDSQMTKNWGNFFDQSQQNQQLSLSNEGFWIPSVSSASDSVDPHTSGGQVAQLEAAYASRATTGAQTPVPGFLIFDPAEVNGGSSMAPNGQLKVLLADGTFHAITNS